MKDDKKQQSSRLSCYLSNDSPNPRGQWKPGEIYTKTCRFTHHHGCCRGDVETLHFVFNDSNLNGYNVQRSIAQKLYRKNIMILGDSLQLWVSVKYWIYQTNQFWYGTLKAVIKIKQHLGQ